MTPGPAPVSLKFVADATCLGCGCVCDDLRVLVGPGRVFSIHQDCELGARWWTAPHPGSASPAARVAGSPTGVEDAVARAAAILASARSVLLWDLSGLTVEAAAQAVRIADRVGAAIDTGASFAEQAAFSRVGEVGATLGEIQDLADLIVFWGVDPVATHPRFLERFVRHWGMINQDRCIILVNAPRTAATMNDVDLSLEIAPGRLGAVLHVVQGLVKGKSPEADPVRRATGLTLGTLQRLADRLLGARYGAIIDAGASDPVAAEATLTLVRDLNQPVGRRFVHLGLAGAGNRPGVESVLLWQTGSPGSIELAAGWPRYLPGEATWAARKEAVDALLVLGDDPLERPEGLATIRIGPGATRSDLPPAAVAIGTGRPGIEAGGTVARSDGVMIPLTAVVDPGDRPDDVTVLKAIADRLGG